MAKPTPAKATMALAWLAIAPALAGPEGLGAGVLEPPEEAGALEEVAGVEGLGVPEVAVEAELTEEEVVVVTGGAASAVKATAAMTARMAAVENFMVRGSGVGLGWGLVGWFGSGTRFERVKSLFVEEKKMIPKTSFLLYCFSSRLFVPYHEPGLVDVPRRRR